MSKFWDERFGREEYVYGKEPNLFLARELSKLKRGKIILPCEGEGRNAVYAASLGWEVRAFDASAAGKVKALRLAGEKGVIIDYVIGDARAVSYPENTFDCVAFIYAHFPAGQRRNIHEKAVSWLKPGGKLILEAFNPLQLQNDSGGPKDPEMLYTEKMISEDFGSLKIEWLKTLQVELSEGDFHQGKADIIQFTGVKKA